MRAWYVAKTKPRLERQTAVVLGQRGRETYLPLIPRRRPAREYAPLFPGYLFVRLDAGSAEWLECRSAPGIAYFLGGDGRPTALPDALIEEIRARVAQEEERRRGPRFHKGERVAIVGGAFDGLEAVFDGTLSAAGRSRVLVAIVSRLVPVNLDEAQLRQVV